MSNFEEQSSINHIENSVRTSQTTHPVSIIKLNLNTKKFGVYRESQPGGTRGIPTTIRSRTVCLPVWYKKITRLKYTEI
jgi:hypothetical protein